MTSSTDSTTVTVISLAATLREAADWLDAHPEVSALSVAVSPSVPARRVLPLHERDGQCQRVAAAGQADGRPAVARETRLAAGAHRGTGWIDSDGELTDAGEDEARLRAEIRRGEWDLPAEFDAHRDYYAPGPANDDSAAILP